MAAFMALAALAGCEQSAAPPARSTAPAASVEPAAASPGAVAAGAIRRGDLGVAATVAETVSALREQQTSAFDLGLLRLELLDAPRLKVTLVERHVLKPEPQPLGAYTYREVGDVHVHLDDDWRDALAAGRPFIAVHVEFGSVEAPTAPKALDELKRRAAEAVAYVRTGLTGSNGCEPWEITANGMSQGRCSYRLLEQRFFPHTHSGYAEPMDPPRMHAVANIARAIRVEASVGLRSGGKDTRRLTCVGPITADEARCELRDAIKP
jgi:hypothetical protein